VPSFLGGYSADSLEELRTLVVAGEESVPLAAAEPPEQEGEEEGQKDSVRAQQQRRDVQLAIDSKFFFNIAQPFLIIFTPLFCRYSKRRVAFARHAGSLIDLCLDLQE
jgi:hypothetical protein